MKMDIELTGFDSLIERLEHLSEHVEPAMSRVLNRAGDQATTALKRHLAEQMGVGVRGMDEYIGVSRANPGNLEYVITISAKFLPLSEFDPHQTRRGISARPWGHRRAFPGSFEWRSEVFVREGRERLPIRTMYGPSAARESERGGGFELVKQIAREVAERRLAGRSSARHHWQGRRQ